MKLQSPPRPTFSSESADVSSTEASRPIDLYYWPTPNGWKVSILLEELGLAYQTHYIDIGAGDQFDPAFLEIAPNNRIPAVVDHDGPEGKPISIFESGAILLYLSRKHGRFYSEDARKQSMIDQWLMWQMGGLGPMAGQAHHFIRYAPETVPYGIQRYRDETARLYRVMDTRLGKSRYLGGDEYSIADMACYGWASLWEWQEQDLSDRPHLRRWLDEVGQRPAVERGMALGRDHRK